MKREKMLLWGLVLLFSVLMSVPFLVPHCGFFALFGIVPLLCMERVATLYGVRKVWIWHYSAFVLWNAFTTFWVCNATVGGGIFAVLANSLQMSLIFGAFRLSRKRLGGVLPYIFLAALWIAWERFYFDAEISWPWLVLGNAFAGSPGCIQWYEYTGTLGGSLWIWACNLGIFGLMVCLSDGSWQRFNAKARMASVIGLLVLFVAPFVVSKVIYDKYEETDNPVEICVLQPNIDPYNKFGGMDRNQQDALLEGQMRSVLVKEDTSKRLLFIAPETFTDNVVVGQWQSNPTMTRFGRILEEYPSCAILFGASTYSIFPSSSRPSYTARRTRNGLWRESHNSALMMEAGREPEIYHKSRLVVAVEKTPYPALFCKIDDLLGGVMGRCVGQDRISLLHFGDIPLGCAVCYESVYGKFCTGYVKEGAELLTVITNDAWWGDTPGYRQHLRYASLRAIETRRDIARCANTGVSAIIDQKGNILERSHWWTQEILRGQVNLNDKETFFVTYGDITGRICSFVALLLAALFLVRMIIRK
ncbi:MAG: apolipoprotein N-acyltransferase [Candidatus Cryptobacteroides sp.]